MQAAAWANSKVEPLAQLEGAAGLIADVAASHSAFGKHNPLKLEGDDDSQGAWAVMTMMPGGFELCYKCNAPVSSEHFERQVTTALYRVVEQYRGTAAQEARGVIVNLVRPIHPTYSRKLYGPKQSLMPGVYLPSLDTGYCSDVQARRRRSHRQSTAPPSAASSASRSASD